MKLATAALLVAPVAAFNMDMTFSVGKKAAALKKAAPKKAAALKKAVPKKAAALKKAVSKVGSTVGLFVSGPLLRNRLNVARLVTSPFSHPIFSDFF